jgi:hypothetical protein
MVRLALLDGAAALANFGESPIRDGVTSSFDQPVES